MKTTIKILVSLTLILCNISCDQITKDQARKEISANETIHVVHDNFILTKVENTGAALSMGSDLSPELKLIFLKILPVVFLILMFVYVIKMKDISRMSLTAISFIIGGGMANIYDRIQFDSVTDFMYLEIGLFHTGIFNMADVSVVVGTLILLLEYGMTQYSQLQKKVSI
jgi:signal peptidase II